MKHLVHDFASQHEKIWAKQTDNVCIIVVVIIVEDREKMNDVTTDSDKNT